MTKMNTMSFILDRRSIEIKRYIIEFTIFDKLTFRRVKLNSILLSIVRAYIAHGFQRMCCWCDKRYIVSISESTAVYVANHAAIGAIQVLRNADGGGGVIFSGKSVTKV